MRNWPNTDTYHQSNNQKSKTFCFCWKRSQGNQHQKFRKYEVKPESEGRGVGTEAFECEEGKNNSSLSWLVQDYHLCIWHTINIHYGYWFYDAFHMGVTQPTSMRLSLCVDLSNKKIGGYDVGHMFKMLFCVPRLDNWSLHLLLLPNICSHYSCPGCISSSPHCQGDIFAHVNAVKLRKAGIWVRLSQKRICLLPSQSKSIQIIMMVTYFLFPSSVHSKIKTKNLFLSVVNVSV